MKKDLTIKEAEEIQEELYNNALLWYLDKIDWDVTEWLSEEDNIIYEKAMNILLGIEVE